MNYSNFSNSTFAIDENFYLKIGSTWTLDTIYLAIISPLGFIGFLLNMICFLTLVKINIKTNDIKLYEYLKVYSLNSACICLILGFSFTTLSPRYFTFFYSPFVKFYRCRIFGYLMVSLIFYNNLLDILISLDRISIFTSRFDFHRKINPYNLSLILLVICFFINSPLAFTYEILSDQSFFTKNVMNSCSLNEIGRSMLGVILNMALIVLRDIILLGLEIIASILIIYFYRTFSKTLPASLNNVKYSISNEIFTLENNTRFSVSQTRNEIESRLTFRQQSSRNFFIMTLILSILSIIAHLLGALVFIILIYSLVQNRLLYYSIFCLGCFSLVFKHLSNIFIFYYCNSFFRTQLRGMIRIRK